MAKGRPRSWPLRLCFPVAGPYIEKLMRGKKWEDAEMEKRGECVGWVKQHLCFSYIPT